MQEKSDDIAMRLMRCSTAHPVSLANVAAVANDLVGRVSRNEDTIRQALLRLAQDQMLICMKAISSNDKAEGKIVAISKQIFHNEYAVIAHYEAKCSTARALLKDAAEYALVAAYMYEDGRIEWSRMNDDVMKAMRGRGDADM
jgi:hypothetical protein